MGFFEKLKNKLEEQLTKEVNTLLLPNEIVELQYKALEDIVVFTEKRIILLDKKILSAGASYISIPYNKITSVIIQKPGTFSFRELGIVVGSQKYEFKMPNDNMDIYQFLLSKTL